MDLGNREVECLQQGKGRDYYEGIHLLQDVSIWILHGAAWLGVYFFLDRYMHGETQLLFGIFWICTITLAAVLLRHFFHKLPFLLAGHGFLYGFVLLSAHETTDLKEERVIFCLLLLTGALLGSVQKWRMGFGHSYYTFPWYLIPEILILYFYGMNQSDPAYQTMAFGLLAVLVMGHFWCMYLQGMNDYLDQNKKLEGISESRIFRINTRVVCSLLLGMLLVTVSVGMVQIDLFSGQLGESLAAVFRMLLVGLQSLIRALQWWNQGETTEQPEEIQAPSATRLPESSGESVDSGYAAIGLMLSLLVFFYLVYRLAKAFDDKDDHVWSRPDYGGDIGIEDRVEKIAEEDRRRFPLFRTNRQKVRHLFKKRVKKALKGQIPSADTAWELTREMQKREKEGSSGLLLLTQLYDVARYGSREISAEEIRQIKR